MNEAREEDKSAHKCITGFLVAPKRPPKRKSSDLFPLATVLVPWIDSCPVFEICVQVGIRSGAASVEARVNLIEPDESLCNCMELIGSSVELAKANIAGIKLAPETIPNSTQLTAVFLLLFLEHSCPFVLLFKPNQLQSPLLVCWQP